MLAGGPMRFDYLPGQSLIRFLQRFAASTMEPWDGPALVTFSDGRYIGAILDRNGLRPSRFTVTADGLMVMASEVGVYDCPDEKVVSKGRLQPGRMLLVDTQQGRIIQDAELKQSIAGSRPHGEWWAGRATLDQLAGGNMQQVGLWLPRSWTG